jgi:C-terminal processing protease CtpA/Prc
VGRSPTGAAAIALVQYTDALLLDLRYNNGGAPSGVAFLCSHFFGPEPVHLNDVHERDNVQQFWTYAHLPGPRYLDRPVFVLTSGMTFSGAEEIAYNLQQLKRATLIGETTRGGAHPVGQFWVGPHVSIRVPTARSVNPVSGTNWESVGVTPDVPTTAAEAYPEAYRRALRAVLERLDSTTSPAERDLRQEATDALARLTRPA